MAPEALEPSLPLGFPSAGMGFIFFECLLLSRLICAEGSGTQDKHQQSGDDEFGKYFIEDASNDSTSNRRRFHQKHQVEVNHRPFCFGMALAKVECIVCQCPTKNGNVRQGNSVASREAHDENVNRNKNPA